MYIKYVWTHLLSFSCASILNLASIQASSFSTLFSFSSVLLYFELTLRFKIVKAVFCLLLEGRIQRAFMLIVTLCGGEGRTNWER